MSFRETANELQDLGFTNEEIGAELGVAESTVRAYRLAPENPGHRRPPEDWRVKLAHLALRRAGDLLKLAGEVGEDDVVDELRAVSTRLSMAARDSNVREGQKLAHLVERLDAVVRSLEEG